MTGLDAGTGGDGSTMLADARRAYKIERAKDEKRERRNRIVLLWLSVAFSAVAVVVSLAAATTRAEDVAAQVTPRVVAALVRPVTEQVIAESRAGRADTARRLLSEENSRLAAADLPIVAFPPVDAQADEVVGAWITARVLRVLPPSITERLAEDVAAGRAPRILPSLGPVSADDLDDGDITVTELPDDPVPAPARRPARATPGPTPAPPVARAPDTAPAPQDTRRGVLQPCLLNRLLC